MKKIYSKPEAELISFYSNEEITSLDGKPVSEFSNEFGLVDKVLDWS